MHDLPILPRPAQRAFIWSAALLLVVASLSKLYSASGEMRLLEVLDPVFLVKNRYLLIGLGLIELIAVIGILTSRHVWFKGLVLLWLSLNFIVYRAALWLSGATTPCPCLGNVAARLGLSSAVAELLTKAVVVYFLIGGGYLLLSHVLHCQRVDPFGESGRLAKEAAQDWWRKAAISRSSESEKPRLQRE